MNILNSREKRHVVLFTAVVISLSSLICFASYKFDNPNVSILNVFTPSIVALVLTAMTKGKKGIYELFVKQTFQKVDIKWLLLSVIGIPVLASFAILTSMGFDISRFNLRTTQLLPQIIVIVLIAIGEEYGWRGYLLPKLMDKLSLFYSSIVLGLIWGVWHFPGHLIETGVPLQMDFMVFLLWVVLATFFISWIYYYTKSVLTSILAHISANAAFNYLPILPEFTGSMNTFLVFIAYMLILMVVVFCHRRKLLIKDPNKK